MFLDFLYSNKITSPQSLVGFYNPPKIFRHGEWESVAFFEKVKDSDGQNVEVFECRFPDRVFKLEAKEGFNSAGELQKSFEISTGSGSNMGDLLGVLAKHITEGKIGVKS